MADSRPPEWKLITQTIRLGDGELSLLQPEEGAEIPDDHQVEWAPLAPYWSILWRSGVALGRELSSIPLSDRRVVELGCGLAVPSLAAGREGAQVLATDASAEALSLVERNAAGNGVHVETALVDWATPDELLSRAPFDLVLGADILYERPNVDRLLELVPRLAPEAWIADPGRPAGEYFLEQARRRWRVETSVHDVVSIHRLRFS